MDDTSFVSHAWKVPRQIVIDVLEANGHGKDDEKRGKGPSNLRQITATNDITVEELIAELQIAIAVHRAKTGSGLPSGALAACPWRTELRAPQHVAGFWNGPRPP